MANPYEKEIYCQRCGTSVIRRAPAQKYCPDCLRYIADENRLVYKERNYHKKKPEYVSKKPQYTLAEVNQAAKNHGMTYGKYVAAWKQGLVEPPEKFAPVKKKRKWGV